MSLYDVGHFHPGDVGCVVSVGTRWWTVRILTGRGVVGWINAELLRKVTNG